MVKKKTTAMVRNGTVCLTGWQIEAVHLKVLQDGHSRRMADGRNAYRKMSREQREAFLRWAHDEDPETWNGWWSRIAR